MVLLTELWFRFPEICFEIGNVSARKTNNICKYTQRKIHHQNITSTNYVTNTDLAKLLIWLERSGHDFEPILKFKNCFKTRPYSNLTSSAKNKLTTEPISIFVPG